MQSLLKTKGVLTKEVFLGSLAGSEHPDSLSGGSQDQGFLKNKREISSAGSEHLPYKQGVTGSNPVSPTKPRQKPGFFYMDTYYFYILYFYIGSLELLGGEINKIHICIF